MIDCSACSGFPCASRAEQQAERSRALADEDVSRIKGQLLSLGSMHQAEATAAQPQSSPPSYAAHHPGLDRYALSAHPPTCHAAWCDTILLQLP